MERTKSIRKRRPPTRLIEDDESIVTGQSDANQSVEQNIIQTNQSVERSVAQTPDQELNQEESEMIPPVATEERSSNVRMRSKVKKTNMGLVYRFFRRSIGALTNKVEELSKEVKNSKISDDNKGGPSDEINLDESQETSEIESANIRSTEPNIVKTSTERECQQVVYNIRNINIERPKFENVKDCHPVTFIEDLEAYLRKSAKDEYNEVELIKECLKGDAKDWARIYCGRWKGLEDFKIDFFATFWGEKEQNELRRKIVHGSWDRQTTPSMLNYFLRITGRAQMLNYKIPEKQLVSDVIRHFPKNVQQVWTTLNKETIIEAAEFLRNMDEINKQEPHAYVNKNFDNKKKEYQQNYRKWQKPTTFNEKGPRNPSQTLNTVNLAGVSVEEEQITAIN